MIRTVTTRHCDRCTSIIGSGANAEDQPPKALSVYTDDEVSGGEYIDLCQTCRRAVGRLLDRVFKRSAPKVSE